MSEYVKTFKEKGRDKNENKKLMSLHIDDDKLLEKMRWNFLLVARCSLVFAHCLLVFACYSLLFACCSLLFARRSLLFTRCSTRNSEGFFLSKGKQKSSPY